ncbi:MAG: redoxin domain-containing protein [Bacteroidales bacterium]|jgi:thiol-disulfide isomerase/thioredoxin|nr:redoxin domain-containing protein [Bacteroidales bacterium]
MKKLSILSVLFCIIFAACGKHYGYIINGNVADLKEGLVTLQNIHCSQPCMDTAYIKDGKFTFKSKLLTADGNSEGAPQMVEIRIEGISNSLTFFLANGSKTTLDIAEAAKLNEALITTDNALMNAALHLDKEIADYEKTVEADYYNMVAQLQNSELPKAKQEELTAKVNALLEEYNNKVNTLQTKYISENPNSHYSIYLVNKRISEYPLDSLGSIIATWETVKDLHNNVYLVRIKAYYENAMATLIGSTAPDFIQNDPNGVPVAFSSIYLKGKITMIDFWASWCGPCRRFNPTLVTLYKKYHPKGLEIIGVSLDKDMDSWTKAIEKDGLTWIHVSDLQYWSNDVAKTFGIRFIPQNVFVDNKGVIIAKTVAEEELEAFLAEKLK